MTGHEMIHVSGLRRMWGLVWRFKDINCQENDTVMVYGHEQ